jgi:hypothetical protein
VDDGRVAADDHHARALLHERPFSLLSAAALVPL